MAEGSTDNGCSLATGQPAIPACSAAEQDTQLGLLSLPLDALAAVLSKLTHRDIRCLASTCSAALTHVLEACPTLRSFRVHYALLPRLAGLSFSADCVPASKRTSSAI